MHFFKDISAIAATNPKTDSPNPVKNP